MTQSFNSPHPLLIPPLRDLSLVTKHAKLTFFEFQFFRISSYPHKVYSSSRANLLEKCVFATILFVFACFHDRINDTPHQSYQGKMYQIMMELWIWTKTGFCWGRGCLKNKIVKFIMMDLWISLNQPRLLERVFKRIYLQLKTLQSMPM